MYDFGNSFVIQLKNGHFIISDGGVQQDMIYLLEYLEKLAPEGQKPVVDAWFISHAHIDHIGCFLEVSKHLDYIKRISVEGFYFSEPNEDVCKQYGDTANVKSVLMACKVFRNSQGKTTPMYRTHAGQRYYFNDISIDIVFSQEIFQVEKSYGKVFNDTSTWMMLNIEGQKVLMPGDADAQTQSSVVSIYSKEYLTVDILQAFHHGYNVYTAVSDRFSFKTVIYPFFTSEFDNWRDEIKEGNQLVRETATEYFSHEDGTKVLTFPYVIGSVQTEPAQTWSHHPGRTPSEGVK
jgi:beta-lactamase superfamily II metal-dependent hydrolase